MTNSKKTINPKRRNLVLIALLIITAILSTGALLLPFSSNNNTVTYELGDVVSQDILSPSTLSFTSDILTTIERDQAEALVPPVFLELDISVASTQVSKLTHDLDFIQETRLDEETAAAQKITFITSIENMSLTNEQAESIVE